MSAAQNWARLEILKLPFPQSNLERATLKQYNVECAIAVFAVKADSNARLEG